MKQPALLLMAMSKILPEMVREAIQVYQACAHPPDQMHIQGCRQMLVIESLDEPGSLIWISTWDRPADSQAFLSSPSYASLLSALRPYLRCTPEWYRYSILEEMKIRQD